MNIVTVSHYYTPHVGGLEIVAEMLVKSLQESGHQMTVITCAANAQSAATEVREGVIVKQFGALNFFDAKFGIPFPIPGFTFLVSLAREVKNSDAVHIHDVFYIPSWAAAVFSFCFRKPLVLTQHVPYVPHTSKVVMLIQALVYATWGSFIFAIARHIIVYNPQVRDFLITRGVSDKKIIHIRNGIYTKRFSRVFGFDKASKKKALGISPQRPVVLFVGRLVPKKGYKALFEARDDSFELVFVGSGEVEESWKQEGHFHFLGPKSQTELAELYQLADLFVFPAQGEMFTLVMQEAMASGLPIIATDEPGYAEFDIDRERLVLCVPTKQELKKQILRVLSDELLQQQMSAYSLELSQLFDWDKNVEPVLSMYEKIK